METQRSSPGPRLHFLDALRGIAASAVFVAHALHYTAPDAERALTRWGDLGVYGVLLFFMISGYVIPLSLDRAGAAIPFWIGRIFRLWPLYLAVLVATVAVSADFTPRTLALNLAPLGEFAGYRTIVNGAWTLAFELTFYALLTAAWALGWRHRAVGMAVAALLLALAVEGLLPPLSGIVLPRYGTLVSFAAMFGGMVICRWQQGKVSARACRWVCLLLAATLLLALRGTGLAVLATFAAFLALRRYELPRILLWLGRVSYSLYLIHALVMFAAPRTGSGVADVALWAALAFGLAALAERWIERPGIALGKRLVAGQFAPHREHLPVPSA